MLIDDSKTMTLTGPIEKCHNYHIIELRHMLYKEIGKGTKQHKMLFIYITKLQESSQTYVHTLRVKTQGPKYNIRKVAIPKNNCITPQNP